MRFIDRYPFLPPKDVRQCVLLGDLIGGADRNQRLRACYAEIERLAHDLGWRRIREDGKRRWVQERIWLKMICYGQVRRVGAPRGNKNAQGHLGQNQYTAIHATPSLA